MPIMNLWKYCLRIYLKFWPITLMTLFGYAGVMVFDSLMPAYVAKSITSVVANGRTPALSWVITVGMAYFAVMVFHFIESHYWSWHQAPRRRWIHMDLYNQVMRNKRFANFKKYPPEYWVDAIYNIQNYETSFAILLDVPRRMLAVITIFIINAIIFFQQDVIVACFILTPALATLSYALYLAIRLSPMKRKLDCARVDLRKSVADSLTNIRSTRAHAQLDTEIQKIDDENLTFTNIDTSIQKINWRLIISPRVVSSICTVCALWFGINAYFNGTMALDLLVFMIVSLATAMRMVEELKFPISNFIDRIASVQRSFQIIYGDAEPCSACGRVITKIKSIQGNNLSFCYEDDNVLHNISFNISAGQHIGIHGRSGVGKTTLFNLILGLYQPQSGNVLINNTPLNLLNMDSVRRHIFMSVQNAPLLNRTLRENIKFANPGISDKKMIVAARQAEIHDFIMSLPNGYDTIAGNVGGRLSGGQINRIMLARAFASDADVLLLDEPTAAVDSKTEAKIIRTINRDFRNRTIVIISHTENVLRAMDSVIKFKKSGVLC